MIRKTGKREVCSAALLCEKRNTAEGMLISIYKWIPALAKCCLPMCIYQICTSGLNCRGTEQLFYQLHIRKLCNKYLMCWGKSEITTLVFSVVGCTLVKSLQTVCKAIFIPFLP